MKKERYLISITGEDGICTEREYTNKEAALVADIINELQTVSEGCSMVKIPNENEIEELKKRFDKYSENDPNKVHAFYEFWRYEIGKDFDYNMYMYTKLEYALTRGMKI